MKQYRLFVFLATFAQALIEVFIPLILYKMGFDIRMIVFYFLVRTIFKLNACYLANYLGKRITFKYILIISALFFTSSLILLDVMSNTIVNLILVAFLQGTFLGLYWTGRHNLALKALPRNHISQSIGIITILVALSSSLAPFISSLVLDNLNKNIIIIIATILFLISTIPLFYLKEQAKLTLTNTRIIFKTMGIQNLLFFGFQQFRDIKVLFLPLWLFIYINNKYSFIGYLSVINCLASIIFIYYLSKYIDKNKKDFTLSIALVTSLVMILQMNSFIPSAIILATFIEGINAKAYGTIIESHFYELGKKYIYTDYILAIEIIYNVTLIILLALALLLNNLTLILYLALMGILISGFINFKLPKKKDLNI